MARTGSGKTACFLIPLFEKLQARSTQGTRALIMSPTRELALQTLKFTRELGKFTGLKAATVLGGDSMEAQFSAMHEIPDIIIATPGRFAHLCVEMELKLKVTSFFPRPFQIHSFLIFFPSMHSRSSTRYSTKPIDFSKWDSASSFWRS